MTTSTAPTHPSYDSPISVMLKSLDSKKKSGFDLVWIAMVIMYMSTEMTLRDQVDKMRDNLEEMDRLRQIANLARQAKASNSPQAMATVMSMAESQGMKVTEIKGTGVDAEKVVAIRIDLGDGYTMDIYVADDAGTAGFDELTGQSFAVDNAGKRIDKGKDGYVDPAPAAISRIVINKDGKADKEILTLGRGYIPVGADPNTIPSATVIFDLNQESKAGLGSRPSIARMWSDYGDNSGNGADLDGTGALGMDDAALGSDGFNYRRRLVSQENEDFAVKLGNGVTLEFGVTDLRLSGVAISRDGASTGLVYHFNNGSAPMTLTSLGEPEQLDKDALDREFQANKAWSFNRDVNGLATRTQDDAYNDDADELTTSSDFVASEKRLKELGFEDGDDEGTAIYDDFFQYLADEGIMELPADGKAITPDQFEAMATAINDKIDSLNSMNQIDMLYLEKSFNILNVLITALSNIESSHNRALTTVANNM